MHQTSASDGRRRPTASNGHHPTSTNENGMNLEGELGNIHRGICQHANQPLPNEGSFSYQYQAPTALQVFQSQIPHRNASNSPPPPLLSPCSEPAPGRRNESNSSAATSRRGCTITATRAPPRRARAPPSRCAPERCDVYVLRGVHHRMPTKKSECVMDVGPRELLSCCLK